ncbi:MAG: M48 metallopeptidase family protein [Acidimicrobiales bacterium]
MDRTDQLSLFDDQLEVAAPARPVTVQVPPTGGAGTPEIEVRTSKRRRKSATAYWSEGRIVVLLPSHLRGTERREMVDWLVGRVMSRRPRAAASDEALFARARQLSRRYVPGAEPQVVRWVTNQNKRWASCTAETGEIRLSHRLKEVPSWVLDAVLVHELAHLVYPDHSPRFHELADRFSRQKDASSFLEGYSLGLDSDVTGPGFD